MTSDLTRAQDVNAWVSFATALTCLLFIVTYAVLARWWRTYEGKIMMAKAIAIMLLASYTWLVVEVVPESTGLRVARVLVIGAIGLFMVFQTVVLVSRQVRRGARSRREIK